MNPSTFRFSLQRVGILAVLVAFIAGALATSANADELQAVGAAKIDITPTYPVRLSGYGSRRDLTAALEQRLFAKALAIGSDAAGPAVLLTVDNVGVPESVRTELVRRLAARAAISDERVAVCSSHTHCAPMLAGMLPNLFGMEIPPDHQASIERYTGELIDKLETVALEALAKRQPARLAWGTGTVGFAANRRNFPTKPVDHTLSVLCATSADGKVRAVLTSYACHCTTLQFNALHGDWAGCAQAALERDFPDAIALTAVGCGADQNPMPRSKLELAVRYGEDLAAEAKRVVLSGTTKQLNGPLTCRTKPIKLAFDTLPTREQWQALADGKSGAPAYQARKVLARLDRGESLSTELPYLVQAWLFGDALAMVFLPGEVVVDYALRLKREFDPARLWVNGYSNDVPCYIPSRRVLEEGGYEGGGAMVYYDRPTRFAPDVEERIVGAVHALIPPSFRAR